MNILLQGAFVLMAGLTLSWIVLTAPSERVGRAGRVLWAIIVFLPIASMLARGRPMYSQSAQVWAAPFDGLINPIQIFGAILAIIVCWGSLHSVQPVFKPLIVAIVFYLLAQLASDLYNDSIGATAGPAISLLVLLAIVMRGEALVTLKSRVTWMLRVYIWSSILVFLIAPMWSVVPTIHASRTFFGLDTRFIGLSAGPNYMALLAALAFLMEIYPLYRQRGWMPSATLALVTCVWSQGRSALLILIVVGAVAIAVQVKSREKLAIATLAVLAVPCASLLLPSVQVRFSEALSAANLRELTTGRTEAWVAAWAEFQQSPVVGRGSSVFGAEYWSDEVGGRGGFEFANAHNQFLQALAQGGILGLVATAYLLGCLIHLAVATARPTRGLSIAALSLILVQLLFGTPLRTTGFSVNLLSLAICAGVVVSIAALPRGGIPGLDESRSRRLATLVRDTPDRAPLHRQAVPGLRGSTQNASRL